MGRMILRPSARPLFLFRSSAVALTAALLMAAALVFAGAAAAHSAPTGSSPENGQTVDRSPGVVSVSFNENLRPEFAYLTVVGPDRHFYQQGDPTVEGKTMSEPVNALGPAGDYEINFRVTSADGHPVQGQRIFTLSVAGDGEPGPLAGPEESAASDDGFPAWAVVLIVVAVLLVLTGAVIVLRRRRSA